MLKKTLKAGLAGAACLIAAASIASAEGSFPAQPASYETKAVDYIESRLSEARGATFIKRGQAYPVTANLKGSRDYECWAVDYTVRSDIGTGSRGLETMTVLFYNGRPVALESDLRRPVSRVAVQTVIAQN